MQIMFDFEAVTINIQSLMLFIFVVEANWLYLFKLLTMILKNSSCCQKNYQNLGHLKLKNKKCIAIILI